MKTFGRILPWLIIVALIGYLGYDYYSKSSNQLEPLTNVDASNIFEEKEVKLTGETVKSSLVSIGSLDTAEYNYTHVESFKSKRTIAGHDIPLTQTSFIYSYDGTITAGIDFAQIEIQVMEEEKEIEVTIPQASIHTSSVDKDSFALYDESNNIFNPISVQDVTVSLKDMEEKEKKKALKEGILDKAERNAISMIDNIIKAIDINQEYTCRVTVK